MKVEVPYNPLEFCPIVIGIYFVRVFHGVHASRIEAYPPPKPSRQSRVCPQTECGPTCSPRQTREPVDIRKAFDSVSHKVILGIHQQKGVLKLLMGYLRSYFSTSRLQTGNNLIHPKHSGVNCTPSRLCWGGRSVDIYCKCGSNAPMSLPHIVQTP
ncbi:unnamed protein product [Acanthosepion pharaonis]|uniref:Reverse transcriptase domain-containing protein n=1 Tax=Acanthosepion pharaonis TaxID=158019 RepID=A0A812CYD3_ACAPH|nr:unnamed protein product [Sepia pharaonis]